MASLVGQDHRSKGLLPFQYLKPGALEAKGKQTSTLVEVQVHQ
uniref:Uncharacterized protein n=1 Tax=Utricularia reniformis TaxID=192314 RepID=A0A1Y0B470_9LAMI|nr:hypothetical protein AEK19_MT1966 [Utricularia reniformis]ART32129.1 hypothetical protein AEK19_MT1966 [Utricularia reniformis]